MCGIYGQFLSRGGLTEAQLTAPRDRLMHRGPDDAGVWLSGDGRVGLAHRRLSILDLSPLGHQPMLTVDKRYVIVFNGEIYNFAALRQALEKQGQTFRSDSDTEVLLGAYRQWGEACLARLNGMFAFVIYDAGTHDAAPSLFMARDRAGKKPFYFVNKPGDFRFASELKALSPDAGLSLTALNHYLALGYVPAAHCIAEGVHKLPPAHCASLNLRTGEIQVKRYWRLPEQGRDTLNDGEAITDEVERLLLDATRLRLQADVPVGVLLSGGLDSSLITAAAAKSMSGTIKTFSVTVPGSALDESARAAQVARTFGTDHHELPLDASGLAALEDIAPFVDEPLADSSLIPTYLVSRLTRGHVTVALGGDGGDELFGGYGDYTQSLADEARLGWLPRPGWSLAASMASMLPAGVRGRNRVASLRQGALQQLIWGRPYFDNVLRGRILSKAAADGLVDECEWQAPEQFLLQLFQQGTSPVDAMTRTHFGSILPDDFLVKVDRASMMVSLEMRAPFLDYRLIEFAYARIPDAWKATLAGSRLIQRKLAKRWLPPEIERAPKMGFSIPMDDWLRKASNVWHERWIDRLPEPIDKNAARKLLAGLLGGRANGSRIFALIMLGNAAYNLGFI